MSPSEEEEEDVHIKIFTVDELTSEVKARRVAGEGAGGKGAKKNPKRLWTPKGDYTLVRKSLPLSQSPDELCHALQEKTLTIFKHNDPDVVFGKDPKRPLWKVVFAMSPEMGYQPGEYYDPKQSHLTAIYLKARPKDKMPSDNVAEKRIPSEKDTPYWPDEWFRMRENVRAHKKNYREKKNKKGSDNESAGTPKNTSKKRTSMAPAVIPVDDVMFFEYPDWLKKTVAKKTGTVFSQTALKKKPLDTLKGSIQAMAREMYRGAPMPSAKRAAEPKKVVVVKKVKKEDAVPPVKPESPKVVVVPKKKTVPSLKREREGEGEVRQTPLKRLAGPARSVLEGFAVGQKAFQNEDLYPAAARYFASLGPDDDPLMFYAPGNPGEALPDILAMCLKKLVQ